MADPRAPIEIAKFPTQFEAAAVAAVVRDAGIDAAIFGDGGAFAGGLGVFGQWTVVVPMEDADRARRVIVEARQAEGEAVALESCPGCGYSMAGLDEVPRCPECGYDTHAAKDHKRAHGLVDATPRSTPAWAWNALAAGLALCAGVGLTALALEELGWSVTRRDWWLPLPIGAIVVAIVTMTVLGRRRSRLRRQAGVEFGSTKKTEP